MLPVNMSSTASALTGLNSSAASALTGLSSSAASALTGLSSSAQNAFILNGAESARDHSYVKWGLATIILIGLAITLCRRSQRGVVLKPRLNMEKKTEVEKEAPLKEIATGKPTEKTPLLTAPVKSVESNAYATRNTTIKAQLDALTDATEIEMTGSHRQFAR